MRHVLTSTALASICIAACGDEKKLAGEPCVATESGAALCASGICLQGVRVPCPDSSETRTLETACAGPGCAPERGCRHDENLDVQMQCATVPNSPLSYCLPAEPCTQTPP